jgi:hypothetical protein
MFDYWIQKHDYSSVEAKNITLSAAIGAFQGFDWALELASYEKDTDGKDCPPGMGLNNGVPLDEQGILLHICPFSRESVFFHFHYTRPGKFLGIFEISRSGIHYVPEYPLARVPELITFLYGDRLDSILDIK